MNELLVFIQSLPEALKTGFIYSIMVMGVYITYKILDFPDMSVDATFPLGGFIFAAFSLSKNGFFGITNPFIGLILAVIGGMIAGYLTGALHVYLKINGLLSGILVMTGFYSINSRIVGVPNVFISSERNIFEIISYEKSFIPFVLVTIILLVLKGFYDYQIKENKYVIRTMIVYVIATIGLFVYVVTTKDIKLMFVIIVAFAIKMILDYILTSKFGFALRALGNNEELVVSLGVNEKRLKILGLMISNGLVALSGALFAQNMKVADLISGTGTLVIGLAAIILGLGVLKKSRLINEISIITIGSLMYYFIINLALMSNSWTKNLYQTLKFNDNLISTLEIKPTDVKIITAVILTIILWNETAKKLKKGKKKAKAMKIKRGEGK
nr:ABC transporter permease [uncultured Leptotrichia sp.]